MAGDKALDHGLDANDAARGHLIRRTLEESAYFAVLWSRWGAEEGWVYLKKLFDDMPAPLRLFVPGIVRKKVLDSIKAQGLGRHTPDEIYDWAVRDLDAVSRSMGAPFVLGKHPRTIDATVYAFFANALLQPMESPIRAFAQGNPVISGYVEHVRNHLQPTEARGSESASPDRASS